MRQGLNRYFKDLYGSDIDIVSDSKLFPKFTEGFYCLLKKVKEEGRGTTDHFAEIDQYDLQKLSNTLDPNIPQQLQWLVFVIIGLFFARRGNENYEKMRKSDFIVLRNTKGIQYICRKFDEITKNHRENDVEKTSGGCIYETGNSRCPVFLFKKYVSKLHKVNEFLWQRCKDSFTEDGAWFSNRKIGINEIKKIMPKISSFCGLSKIYTNHCLRVTSCTILGEKHTENEVKCVSGHKSNSSLGIYKRVKDSKKEEMSMDLANAMGIGTSNNDALQELDLDNDWLLEQIQSIEGKAENASSLSRPEFTFNNCNVTINVNR